MPTSSRPPLDPRTVELLQIVATTFDSMKIPYAVAGGMAMLTHGIVRSTADVDVFVPSAARRAIFQALRKQGLDIEDAFAPFHYMAWKPEHGDPRIRIDLLFPNASIEVFGMKHAVRGGMWNMEYNVLAAPVLATIKFLAHDEEDEETDRHGNDVDLLYRKGVITASSVHTLIEQESPAEAERFTKRILQIDQRDAVSVRRSPRSR